MLWLEFAKLRLSAILSEIRGLKESDFPYSHSRKALEQIELGLQARLAELNKLTPKNAEAVIRVKCRESLFQLNLYLPLLGFIVRSTTIRNSFEVFGPLLRLSRRILGPSVKLILSSEWVYTPHVYNPIPDLPDFVLLGLPASESGNPLLIPISGHELGHAIWQRTKLADRFGPLLESKLIELAQANPATYKKHFGGDPIDLLATQNLAPAWEVALKQCEESFCDFIGIRIFSESYLYAYAYLLTPGGFVRTVRYPSGQDRIANLENAAEQFGVTIPNGFADWFANETTPTLNEKEMHLVKSADEVRELFINDLITEADAIVTKAGVGRRVANKVDVVLDSFRLNTPAEHIGDVPTLMNAAWHVFRDPDFWKDMTADERTSALHELVLKSCEIIEYEERIA